MVVYTGLYVPDSDPWLFSGMLALQSEPTWLSATLWNSASEVLIDFCDQKRGFTDQIPGSKIDYKILSGVDVFCKYFGTWTTKFLAHVNLSVLKV